MRQRDSGDVIIDRQDAGTTIAGREWRVRSLAYYDRRLMVTYNGPAPSSTSIG